MGSSRNWTLIQTQTLETELYFCRHLEQKYLQKLNNPVKTLVIQNSVREYPLSLSIQVSFGVPDTKTWNALVWEIKCFMRAIKRVASLLLMTDFEERLVANMIKRNLFNGWINLCSCNTHLSKLNNALIHFTECVQS